MATLLLTLHLTSPIWSVDVKMLDHSTMILILRMGLSLFAKDGHLTNIGLLMVGPSRTVIDVSFSVAKVICLKIIQMLFYIFCRA